MTEFDISSLIADIFRNEQGEDTLDTADTDTIIFPNDNGTVSTLREDRAHDKLFMDGEEHWLRPSIVDQLNLWAHGKAPFPLDAASYWNDEQQFQVFLTLLMTHPDRLDPVQIIDKFVEADELAMSRGRHPSATV